MIKVGLIGEDIHGGFLEAYPLKVETIAFVDGEGNVGQVLEGKGLETYLEEEAVGSDFGISKLTASLSLVLQGLRSFEEVSFSIVLLPVYPPAESMKALARALQWMQEEVAPDFLQIAYSTAEGKYQQEQQRWVDQLTAQGCQIIAPVGAPPSFPSSLNGVVAVSDKGFVLAGFDGVKTDVVIEEETAIIFDQNAWKKLGLSTELASAIELKNRIAQRLEQESAPESSPVILPDLELLIAIQKDLKEEGYDQPPMKPGLIQKGKSYLKSVLSRLITPTGRVPAYIKEMRRVSCNGDGGQLGPCPFREESTRQPGSFVCGACGCGDRDAVLVDGDMPRYGKLDYPFVSCPASMPGFSNYVASQQEANPGKRKIAIEAKYGEDKIEKATSKQAALSAKLEKRLGWLEKL